jgi:hypothetical protein
MSKGAVIAAALTIVVFATSAAGPAAMAGPKVYANTPAGPAAGAFGFRGDTPRAHASVPTVTDLVIDPFQPTRAAPRQPQSRHFHGVVNRFSQGRRDR